MSIQKKRMILSAAAVGLVIVIAFAVFRGDGTDPAELTGPASPWAGAKPAADTKAGQPIGRAPTSSSSPSSSSALSRRSDTAKEWIARFDAAKSDDAKIAVLNQTMSESLASLAALGAHALGEGNASQAVQLETLTSALGLLGSDALRVVTAGLENSDPEVRLGALHVARDLPEEETRVEALAAGLQSDDQDTRDASLVELTRENSKAALSVIADGLSASDPELVNEIWQDTAPAVLELRTKPFESGEEAAAWWKSVEHRFDDDLNLVDPSE